MTTTNTHPTLRDKIRAEKLERSERYAQFEKIMADAWAAGVAAGENTKPSVMVVQQHANPLDDASGVVKQWIEPEGPCGFAWVKIFPATSSFGRWAQKTGAAGRAYGGGLEIWISLFNQSIERKEACAEAMARVMRDAGIKAYAGSRLD